MSNADLSNLRLEVEADHADGLVNRIKNPNGDLGAWGWVTPVDHTYLKGGVGQASPKLTFIGEAAATAVWLTSEPMPVVPGQYVAGFFVDQGGTVARYRASIEWLDSTLVVLSAAGPWPGGISGSAWTPAAGAARTLGAVVVPPGAVFARIRVDFYSSTNAAPGAFSWSFNQATFVTGATAAALGPTRTNLISSHAFTDATLPGWAANAAGATVAQATAPGTSTAAMRMRPAVAAGTQSFGAYHLLLPITSGRDYVFSIVPRAAVATGRTRPAQGVLGIGWYSSDGKVISATTAPLSILATETTHYVSGSAPTNAVYAKAYISLAGSSTAEYYITGAQLELGSYPTAMIEGSVTSSIGYVAPDEFINILGDTHSIRVDPRGELQVGTMSATIVNSALDPSVASFITPGKRVRLMAKTAATDTAADWQPVYTGRLVQAAVDYDLLNPKVAKRATISLTAVDNVSTLAKAPRAEGVGTIAETPFILEGAGAPWNVNGSGDEVSTATRVSYNDQATAADQLAITRDSTLGYAWVDRFNVVQVWDRAHIPATVKATLTEADYTADLGVEYDTDRVIDNVLVNLLTYDVGHGVVGQVTYGPYILAGTDGAHQKTFTVAGLAEAAIPGYARQILALNGTPSRRIDNVVVPIRVDDATGLVDAKALLDLYDMVTLVNARAGMNFSQRIVNITHEITAQATGTGGAGAKWLMTLGFAAEDSVAPPQILPAAQIGAITKSLGQWNESVGVNFPDPLLDLITGSSTSTVGGIPDVGNLGDLALIGDAAYVCTLPYTSGGTLEANWTQATDRRTIVLIATHATAVFAADNANAAAQTAQIAANGKNRILYVATPPTTSTPGIVNDTAWVFSGARITGQYKLVTVSGSTYTWQSQLIDSAAIANLDVGKITGGLADFISATITNLTAISITASTTTWSIPVGGTSFITQITGTGIVSSAANGTPVSVKIRSGLSVFGGGLYSANNITTDGSISAAGSINASGNVTAGNYIVAPNLPTTTTVSPNLVVSMPSGTFFRYTGSSRDVKNSITPADVAADVEAIRGIVLYWFHYFGDPEQRLMLAPMVEDMLAAGLSRYVDFDENGTPFQPAWLQIIALLLVADKSNASRIDTLEAVVLNLVRSTS